MLALVEGRLEEAKALIRRRVNNRCDLESVYREVFEPAHHQLLQMQQTGCLTPARRHHMLLSIQGLIEAYSDLVFASEPRGPRVLVTSMPADLHDITARIVADLLELEGFDTSFLSAPSDVEEIGRCVFSESYDLVVIVPTQTVAAVTAAEVLTKLRCADRRCRLLLAAREPDAGDITPPGDSGLFPVRASEVIAMVKKLIGMDPVGEQHLGPG